MSPPSHQPTLDQALLHARSLGVDRLDAQLLLSHVLGHAGDQGQSRAWLLAHGDEQLSADQQARYAAALAQRAAGQPLAYLVGEKEFHGLTLHVSPAVLVPRPDTETLVDWALELLHARLAPPAAPGGEAVRVLDLGTGSGAVALALAHAASAAGAERPSAAGAVTPEPTPVTQQTRLYPHGLVQSRLHICATDLSPAALAVAQANAARLGLGLNGELEWRQGSWWVPLGERRFDLIVSNPPYIAEGDPHLPDLRFEPDLALSSGADGLDAIRTIAAGAGAHLQPGAWLLLEHGWDQAAAVAQLLHACGLHDVTHRADLAGHLRCTGGRWPG